MENINIIKKLENIETMLQQQTLLQKDVLSLNESCAYLEISPSHMYKLTSQKRIPHFCPQGKKLYFKREELDLWLQSNRQDSCDEVEARAANYLLKHKRV